MRIELIEFLLVLRGFVWLFQVVRVLVLSQMAVLCRKFLGLNRIKM